MKRILGPVAEFDAKHPEVFGWLLAAFGALLIFDGCYHSRAKKAKETEAQNG
jgi:hypothetical protein